MKNSDGSTMTREQADSMLQSVLVTLAKNAVHEKRLLEYADDLERYIAYLDREEREDAEEEKSEPDTKAE